MNASERIDQYIAELADWRGQMVARLRKLVQEADSGITEEWKWDTPVWSHFHSSMKSGFSSKP